MLPGRFNIMARIPGKSGKPGLTYICHMDTVMLGDGWSKDTPALGAVVRQEDGAKRLYGRGACDMKSGLACALTAFARAVELGGRPDSFHSDLCLYGTVDEEDFMRGVEQAAIRMAGYSGMTGYWIQSPRTGRFRWPTRGGPGLSLPWTESRPMPAIPGRGRMRLPPWQRRSALYGSPLQTVRPIPDLGTYHRDLWSDNRGIPPLCGAGYM